MPILHSSGRVSIHRICAAEDTSAPQISWCDGQPPELLHRADNRNNCSIGREICVTIFH